MDIRLVYGNIAEMRVDGIVNASNGVGYMGGQRCINALYPGVAESIQYASQGLVEKEAKANCKENNRFNCYASGNVFITDAPGLLAKYVLHAVTMRFPGSKAKATTIDKLIPLIFEEVNKLNLNSIAIPLLGTGTGRLDKMYVYHKIISYDNILSNTKNCNATVYIVCPNKKFFNSINKESYPVNFINLVNDLHNECKDKLLQINPTITNMFQSFASELERQLLMPDVYNKLKKAPLNIKDFCRIVYTKSSAYSIMSYIANTDFDFSSFAYVSYCEINSDFLSCVDYHFYSRVDNRSFSVIYNFEDSNCSFCYNDKDFKIVTINDINMAIQNNTHSELFKLKYKK